MANCKECVHVEVCRDYIKAALDDFDESLMCGDDCEFYKDRSKIVELPYKIGDKAFRVAGNGEIEEGEVMGFFFGASGQTLEIAFSTEPEHCGVINEAFVKKTREEAEQALKEREMMSEKPFDKENVQINNAVLEDNNSSKKRYISDRELRITIEALDIFCKAWCLNRTDNSKDWSARCRICEFRTDDGRCLIKRFKSSKAPYYEFDFGEQV